MIAPPSYPALEANPPILLGPGPSNVPPQVLEAMAHPMLGHLDPAFLETMDRIQELLKYTFQTDNTLTIPVSPPARASTKD